MLQCVAVCYNGLQCGVSEMIFESPQLIDAFCCNALQLQCAAVCIAVRCSMVQCVAVCCSVLQCVAVCYSVLQCVVSEMIFESPQLTAALCCNVLPLQCIAMWCSVLQCVAVWCSALQCVPVCCSLLQCVALCCIVLQCVVSVMIFESAQCTVALCCNVLHLQCGAVWFSVSQCVAVWCSALQWDAVCCSVLQCVAVCR